MQQPRVPLWFLVANWALVVCAFVVGCMVGGTRHPDLPQPQSDAFGLIYDEILRSHVEEHDGHELIDGAIAAMVENLDPYSRYVSPNELKRYEERSTGHYEGVGMVFGQHGEDLVVHYPFPGGPADRAGARPGDILIAVDDRKLGDLPVDDRNEAAVQLVRGPAGTTVRMRVRRETGEVELSMQRSDVQRSPVKWAHLADPEQGLGYVFVSDFHPGVAERVAHAVESLRERGELRGLVLDLRYDGGGSLDECIAMARSFLPAGTIVSQRRRGREVEVFEAKPESCRFPDLPLVVLVNGNSASASEVLTAALQDNGRAAVVGTPTYGKGYVNTVYTWGKHPFRLKLTTAHFYTPKGRNLERRTHAQDGPSNGNAGAEDDGGIRPDVRVDVDEGAADTILAALIQHEPPAAWLDALTKVATKYGFEVPRGPKAETDPQLAQALAVLRERAAAPARDR
jgi:carboxyl-terminal processing protease